jgi:hypothetical protein
LLALSLAAFAAMAFPAFAQHNPSLNNRPALPPPTDHPDAINPTSLPLIEDLGIEAAKEKARQAKRLLLIFWCGDKPNPNWTFCRSSNSLSLRAYIKWHCIAIQTTILPHPLADQVCATLKAQRQESPAVIILRDGAIEQVVGTDVPMIDYKNDPFDFCPHYPCTDISRNVGCNCKQFTPGPLRVLYQTDFALDRIKARDPVWGELHDIANPPPKPPPEPEPASNTKDDLAPIVWDPRPEEKIGALDRLAQARALVKSGDLYQATGIYSWLWERAADFDPTFRPARMSAVAQDIAALIARHRAARERFEKIRAVRTERMPWADHGQMHDWFVLNAATGNPHESVEFLDYFISDLDEGSIIPPSDKVAFNLLSRREDFASAWQLPPASASPQARVASIIQRLNPRFPSTVTPEAAEEYRAFARQFLLDEGGRLYVALLVKGDDVAAQEIAKSILAARNDSTARLSLISIALSADPAQPRAIHLIWLDDAEAAGSPKRPDLRTKLVLGLNPAPKP